MPYIRRLTKEFGGYGGPEPMLYYPQQPMQQQMGMMPPVAPMAGMLNSTPQMQIIPPQPNMIVIDQEPMTPARMQEITSANRMKALQQMSAGYIPGTMQPESFTMTPQQRPVSPSPRGNPMMQGISDQRKNMFQQPVTPQQGGR